MDENRLAHFLKKRANHNVMFSIGSSMTLNEAHELEQLGYGELRGGDAGLFWLHPKTGNEVTGQHIGCAVQEPEKISDKRSNQIQWAGGSYKQRRKEKRG